MILQIHLSGIIWTYITQFLTTVWQAWCKNYNKVCTSYSIYYICIYNVSAMEMHTSCFLSFRLCMRDGDKRRQAKAYSLCGWKLSFQLARHPVIRSIHLSGLSLVATLRARSLSAFSLSGLQLFSDPDTGQPLPLSILPSTEETRDTEADTALLQPTHCVYIQQINTNMAGGIWDPAWGLNPAATATYIIHT